MKNSDNLNFLLIDKIEEEESSLSFLDKIFKYKFKLSLLFLFLILFFIFYFLFLARINLFELKDKNYIFEIKDGESVSEIATDLKNNKIIKSEIAFKILMKIQKKNDFAVAGLYNFKEDDNLISLVEKISNGKYSIPPIKITIPEGFENIELAMTIEKSFSDYNLEWNNVKNISEFSSNNILENIKDRSGTLFPDTYLFLPNVSLTEVLNKFENNFYKKLKSNFENLENSEIKIYNADLKDFNFDNYLNKKTGNLNDLDLNKKVTIINQIGTTTISLKDILIMASFLEGEAANEEDMRIISGILWTRLKIGMYLQIDAATSTYKIKGLTKNPINNPGSIAIKAAMNPIKTNYIYYITDNDLIMRYARTYDEHLKNINKYLRNKK